MSRLYPESWKNLVKHLLPEPTSYEDKRTSVDIFENGDGGELFE